MVGDSDLGVVETAVSGRTGVGVAGDGVSLETAVLTAVGVGSGGDVTGMTVAGGGNVGVGGISATRISS